MGAPVSTFLRQYKLDICAAWEVRARAEIPVAQPLARAALVDHLPGFLEALADWAEGTPGDASRGLNAVAAGHAIERLGIGYDIDALTLEFSVLRRVILDELLRVESSGDVRVALVRVNDGMDVAVNEAVRRYSLRRDEIRERFIGILGHDLRSPIAAMLIDIDALRRAPDLSERQLQALARMRRTGNRIDRMIRDVVDFARGHLGGGIPAVPASNDMGEICRAAVEELHVAQPARDIQADVSGDLRGFWDGDRVVQAISNLVSNALHHGCDPIVVTARPLDAHTVLTEVSNAGTLAPELVTSIFDPFQQGAGARTAREGLGLGLFIVRQIALAHAGVCEVASTQGRTTFSITWPRRRVIPAPHAHERHAATSTGDDANRPA